MARMNPQAISSEASPSAVPATVTPPSISPLRIAVAPLRIAADSVAPTNRVRSSRSSRRRSQGGSDWDGR